MSSNSTDSFTFSSSSSNPLLVPSSQASKNDSLSTVASISTREPKDDKFLQNSNVVTKETPIAFSEDPFALKDDNTTIKPRKGVYDVTENSFESVSRSGVKPRKGVILDGLVSLNNSKSKVKPRKGVGPFQSQSLSPPVNTILPLMHEQLSTAKIAPTTTSSISSYKDTIADNIVSALEKVFEDDSRVNHVKSSVVPPISSSTTESLQSSATVVNSLTPTPAVYTHASTATDKSSSALQSSLTTSLITTSSERTPDLVTTVVQTTENFGQYFQPLSSRPSIFEHSKLLFHESESSNEAKSVEDQESYTEESESERRYKSSMHLLLSLVFGLLVLFSVLGVIAKRVYDSWMRRHYRRMDFLIDGMYNGYG